MRLLDRNGHGIIKSTKEMSFTTGEKYYKFYNDEVSEITLNQYLSNKYGKGNTEWLKPFYEVEILKNGNFLSVFYQEGIIRLHQLNGTVINEIHKIHSPLGFGIYGITLDNNENLWIAVPSEHYVGKFNYKTGEEIFSICGTKEMEPQLFNHPENVVSIKDKIYVSDMGNERLVILDSITHKIIDEKKLNEPIYYYNEDEKGKYYLLASGLYFESKKTN